MNVPVSSHVGPGFSVFIVPTLMAVTVPGEPPAERTGDADAARVGPWLC